MSEHFKIKKDEHGIIRLFSIAAAANPTEISAEPDYAVDADDPPWPLRDALGVTYLDSDFIEIFPVSDLTGLGLSGYMTEGLGIAVTDIAEFRAQLEAIKGHVLIVFSAAFGGFETTISPRAPLTWIGTFTEETAPTQFKPLPSEGAQGQVEPGRSPKPSDAAMSGRVATVVLLVLFAFVAFLVWIAS